MSRDTTDIDCLNYYLPRVFLKMMVSTFVCIVLTMIALVVICLGLTAKCALNSLTTQGGRSPARLGASGGGGTVRNHEAIVPPNFASPLWNNMACLQTKFPRWFYQFGLPSYWAKTNYGCFAPLNSQNPTSGRTGDECSVFECSMGHARERSLLGGRRRAAAGIWCRPGLWLQPFAQPQLGLSAEWSIGYAYTVLKLRHNPRALQDFGMQDHGAGSAASCPVQPPSCLISV